MFFSAITKNLNWEILTKNLVTFKRWDWVKDKKILCYEGPLQKPISRERGFTRNQNIEGNCLKRGNLDSLKI